MNKLYSHMQHFSIHNRQQIEVLIQILYGYINQSIVQCMYVCMNAQA